MCVIYLEMIEEYVCVFTFVFVRLFFGEPCYILSESVKPVFSRCLIADLFVGVITIRGLGSDC